MSKYNKENYLEELQQRIANIVSHVLYLYEKKIISERTKNEILELCNPEVFKETIKRR